MTSKHNDRSEILDISLQQMHERKASLADCLRAHPDAVSELSPLLETAKVIHEALIPGSPSPEFITASEVRLRRRMQAVVASKKQNRPNFSISARWVGVRTAVALSVLTVAVLLTTGWSVTSVSAQAIPGDTLYPVKLGIEEISLALSFSADNDIVLLGGFADNRLAEVQELIRQNRDEDLLTGLHNYEEALERLDSAIGQSSTDSDPSKLEEIQARLTRHIGVLSDLLAVVPQPAQAALEHAIERSQKSQTQVEDLKQGKGPDNLPPGQEDKSTPDSGKEDGKPTSKNTPGPKLKKATKTPKPGK